MLDCYLFIEGAPGESTDKAHTDWIEVKSFSHAMAQPQNDSQSFASSGPTERTTHGVFSLHKLLDRSSPRLAEICCGGERIPEVIVSLNRTVGNQKVEYMRYTMRDVYVSLFSYGGSDSGPHTRPLEEIGLSYGEIEWLFTEKKRDTSAGGAVGFGWSNKFNGPLAVTA